jgi:hypothetical protein
MWANDSSPRQQREPLAPLFGREREIPTLPRGGDSNVVAVSHGNRNFVFLLGGGVVIQYDSSQSIGQSIEIRDPLREDNIGAITRRWPASSERIRWHSSELGCGVPTLTSPCRFHAGMKHIVLRVTSVTQPAHLDIVLMPRGRRVITGVFIHQTGCSFHASRRTSPFAQRVHTRWQHSRRGRSARRHSGRLDAHQLLRSADTHEEAKGQSQIVVG